MSYKILPHTADLRMFVAGDSLEILFSEALAGMASILNKKIKIGAEKETVKREIEIDSPDQTALLIDFLNKALSLSQINREVYTRAVFKKFSPTFLSGTLEGVPIGKFDEDIKAATYHEADIQQDKDGSWKTIVIFDI